MTIAMTYVIVAAVTYDIMLYPNSKSLIKNIENEIKRNKNKIYYL